MMIEKYYGLYTDKKIPGYHAVAFGNPEGDTTRELIRVPTLELDGQCLVIVYRVLADGLSDASAKSLISKVLLGEFYKPEYFAEAKEILFANECTGERSVVPFPFSSPSG